ncbi:unnamed protein product [Brassica oleracea]
MRRRRLRRKLPPVARRGHLRLNPKSELEEVKPLIHTVRIAERLWRERIAERMKSLQEFVPNGNKIDKASMLDEIIDYVKFLQFLVIPLAFCSYIFWVVNHNL